MKIALAQTDIIWEDKKANLHIAESFIAKASEENIDLILFPEMCFTGFTMNVENCGEVYDWNSEIPSQSSAETTIALVKTLAINHGINIGFGYIEKILGQAKGRNNYAIMSKDGEILSNYSKIHPFSFGTESHYYFGGEKIVHCRVNNLNVSTFICYDLRFPEIFQIASKEAELITVAASWPKGRINHWIDLLKARAIENQCYIAGINRVGIGDGLEYNGNSLIVDPLGNIVASSLENIEGLIVAELDVDLVHSLRRDFPLKADRRESLYKELLIDNIEAINESIH
ncbi:nitrilase-related carbon-nitrogen hydrolase [Clostridium tunisiense]|uniref:nitrilase-related carbon-nitrogen hydrolase n=1 Tax=Clostridium tunisiense TaxID=219748 RepID=UPI00030C662C|nr:nitrilase-related carbon-nitrogen hydrolase [Clostridium tunisiense]